MPKPSLRPLRSLLLCALVPLAACGGVTRRVDPTYDFAAVRSFAWKDAPRLADDAPDENLLRSLERTVERALEDGGWQLVKKEEADVVISATLTIATEVYRLDPVFTQFEAEEVEQGVLTIEVYDRPGRRVVWIGEDRRDLRVLRRAHGGMTSNWTNAGEQRSWHIERMVDSVVSHLPR